MRDETTYVGTSKLPENHHLSSLDGDALSQQVGSGPRVEVGKEAVDTGFSPAGEGSAERDELLDGLKVVLVRARLGTLALEDVAEKGSVADFLRDISDLY